MEPTTFNIGAYVLIPILAAVLGGWVGAFFGNKYQKAKEDEKMADVRAIAIKALGIIKKYSKQSYCMAESDFNTSLKITDKRSIIVLLHKLGIPVFVPADETFDIHKIHFADRIIDQDEIEGMEFQVIQKRCDYLFYIDAENYFNSNRQLTAIRDVGKKYIRNVLAKSIFDTKTKQVSYPDSWVKTFGPGEYLSIRTLHEQACLDMVYNLDGKVDPNRIEQMIHEVDMGIWDNSLLGNYEMYKSAKMQINMSYLFQTWAQQQAPKQIVINNKNV